MAEAEAALRVFTAFIALFVEGVAVLLIAYGGIETLVYVVGQLSGLMPRGSGWRREMFVRFGRWLILGLEFALAADIVRSVISPTWNDIGQLAAIAVIRTFLNYFLEKDVEEARAFKT
ncbi:MAG TPA: DUF1622 domain-containing protein [Rhizomicrobium sp.]|nr:DUF1622 domain-containing protein [Rhizomicrobium sp.]